MGNTLRRLGCICGDHNSEDQFQVGGHVGGQGGAVVYQAGPLGPHGVTVETVGFAALARDLFRFEITSKVPEGLSEYVQATKATQVIWYRKLLEAWKSVRPPPSNAVEASQLVLQTLHTQRKADLQGFLSFYGLPPSGASTVAVPAPTVVVPAPAALYPQIAIVTSGRPRGVQYELDTLPLDNRSVADGDTITVYVDVQRDTRETAALPHAVTEAMSRRVTARMHHDYKTADALQKQIQQAGYKLFSARDGKEEILARKYRVRLRGVDAPEINQPYGQQAKALLLSLVEGRSLHLLVYTVDQYGRIVADVHCNKVFIQEVLLKRGCAWHYIAYDRRPEFAQWEQEARAKGLGLWAVADPQKPWEYRKENHR